MARTFIGIAVSEETISLAVRPPGNSLSYANTTSMLDCLVDIIASLEPALIVLSEFDRRGCAQPLLQRLLIARLPVTLVKPHRVLAFARRLVSRRKPNELDAAILAYYAEFVYRG